MLYYNLSFYYKFFILYAVLLIACGSAGCKYKATVGFPWNTKIVFAEFIRSAWDKFKL